jgi:putative flippase GtrA
MTRSRAAFFRLGRFGIVGIGTNISLYLVFLGLIWVNLDPVLASGLCYGLGVVLSYLLNRSWTFASQGSHSRDLPRFLLAYGAGLLITLLSMGMLTRWLNPAHAQLLTIGIAALTIYGSLHVFRFGKRV